MRNGGTYCPPWTKKIAESELRIKSKEFQPIKKRHLILIAMHLQRCRIRRGQGLVSYRPKNIRVRKTPSIKVLSITELCARSLECIRASINCIAQKIALGADPTRNPSRKAWE